MSWDGFKMEKQESKRPPSSGFGRAGLQHKCSLGSFGPRIIGRGWECTVHTTHQPGTAGKDAKQKILRLAPASPRHCQPAPS